MRIPETFDTIRPFEPDELPEVYDRLLQNRQFQAVLAWLYPDKSLDEIGQKMRSCKSNLEFQKAFCYEFLQNLLREKSLGCTIDASDVDAQRNYTFISNHRDIVLDSALLDEMLVDAGFQTTCEIAIGDNLLALPWVKDLVRINKSFIVERNLPLRETLVASRRLSEYMHFVIAEKRDNIWIAQREGRAKDSDDRTQEAVLKMMAMGGEGSLVERIKQMHIVPTAISYEYDPCDWLKAREFQLRRDQPEWKKTAEDDIESMRTGIFGWKGHIHYHLAPCIDTWLDGLDPETPKTDLFHILARHIDQEIHRRYRIYATNYIAADLLTSSTDFSDHYTADERQAFEQYLAERIELIDLPNRDDKFLRERLLTMYANPLRNQLASLKIDEA